MVGLDYLEEEGLQQTAWSEDLRKTAFDFSKFGNLTENPLL